MISRRIDIDIAWDKRLGRRLIGREVVEDRARGAYLNARALRALITLFSAVVSVGAVFLAYGHGVH